MGDYANQVIALREARDAGIAAERDRVREALADWKTRASIRTAVDCTEDDARAVVDCIAARHAPAALLRAAAEVLRERVKPAEHMDVSAGDATVAARTCERLAARLDADAGGRNGT